MAQRTDLLGVTQSRARLRQKSGNRRQIDDLRDVRLRRCKSKSAGATIVKPRPAFNPEYTGSSNANMLTRQVIFR